MTTYNAEGKELCFICLEREAKERIKCHSFDMNDSWICHKCNTVFIKSVEQYEQETVDLLKRMHIKQMY